MFSQSPGISPLPSNLHPNFSCSLFLKTHTNHFQ
uniref:Uncharacterized protein n=1 Tax=Anguilla anguilla TaxID=7936 RepID=A0A0E9XUM2_ANGAN